MAITLSTAARNAACDAVVDLIDAGAGAGKLRIKERRHSPRHPRKTRCVRPMTSKKTTDRRKRRPVEPEVYRISRPRTLTDRERREQAIRDRALVLKGS